MNASDSSGEAEAQPAGPRLKLVLPIAVIAVIIGGVTLLLTGGSSKQPLPGNAGTAKSAAFAGATLEPPQTAPPLDTLRNYDGSSFSLGSQRGKAVFVTFLYSHCPDVCPLIASKLHSAYASLPSALRTRVSLVAVSVDPHGDSAGAVAAFVRKHQLSGEARYLIGSAQRLVPVWKAWNVGSEADTSRPDLVNHSALVYGIGGNGRIYTVYAANFTPGQVIHDVRPLLAR